MQTDEASARIRALEQALAASERRNQELLRALEYIPNAVQIYDEGGTATYLNPAMVRMTGVPSADVAIGKFNILSDAFSVETGVNVLYERAYRGEVVETDEFTIDMGRAAKDWGTSDHRIWFKMVLVPTFGVDGEVESVFAIMFETTDKRRLTRLLERSSRRDGIELIVGGVAHDFHNLLTTIMMNTELIVDETTDGDLLALSDDILGASDQAVFLSRQLLSYSGRQQKSMRTMDLSALTRDICRVFRHTVAQVGRLTVRLPAEATLAEVDSGQFKQVVMNLLTNGMQALRGEDGHLEVELGPQVLGASELEAFQFSEPAAPGAWHQLCIRDNGVGMPPEVREQIFEPYFTTKADGHGLGLAALLGIVWSHGGGVAVQSAPNEGSRFTILWPISAQAIEPVVNAPVAASVPAGCQVFLGDPSPYVRGSLRALLQRAGVGVEEFGDGREARDAVLAKPDWPDLVVLEIMLTSLNGLDVLREIRGLDRTLPVLLLGSQNELGRLAAEGDPHTDFLAKPFSSKDFMRRAEVLLANAGPSS